MLPKRRPRIFIADDDPATVDLLRTRLELAGYETSYARDGHGALAGVRDTQPAALVLDLGMPGMDGFEVLRSLRAQPEGRRTPVLVLSARHAPDDVQKAVSLGARDYLSKPFDDAQLLRRVARLLRSPRAPIAPSSPAAAQPPAPEHNVAPPSPNPPGAKADDDYWL